MRFISPPPVPEGFVTMAECHTCNDITREFLTIEASHGGYLVLCIRCITAIVDAASDQLLTKADSQA